MSVVAEVISSLTTLFMIITIPLYFVFLAVLHKYRNDELLKSAFFRLMFSLGLAGLGQLFTVLLGNTLASSGLVPGFYIWMGGLSSRLNFCAIYGFGFAQTFAVTMIAINRFTAYLFPLRHMKIWMDSLTKKIIIFQWTVAFLLIIPVAFIYQFQIEVEADNKTVSLQWTSAADNGMYTLFVGGSLGILMTLIIIVLYTIIFAAALIRKIRSGSTIQRTEKSALQMAVVGFICSVGLVIYLGDVIIQMVAWNLFQYNFLDAETNWLIYNFGNSIFAAIDPYAMLLFSQTVRRRLIAMICFWKKNSQNGVTVTAATLSNNRQTVSVRHALKL